MLLVALLAAAAVATPSAAPPPPDELDDLRTKLLDRINEHRAAGGLAALTVNETAQTAAQVQAEMMEDAGRLSHTDENGHSPYDRFVFYGGHASYYGENVARRWPAPDTADGLWYVISNLDALMFAERPPDDGHRLNMISHHFSEVGIGIAVGPNGVFITEDFVGFEPEK
jgi:uncharacterized protein YkwD